MRDPVQRLPVRGGSGPPFLERLAGDELREALPHLLVHEALISSTDEKFIAASSYSRASRGEALRRPRLTGEMSAGFI